MEYDNFDDLKNLLGYEGTVRRNRIGGSYCSKDIRFGSSISNMPEYLNGLNNMSR